MMPALALEIVAVALGVVYVVLAARPSVWCWPFGILGSLASVALFLDARLYGEAGLNVLYAILGVVGWVGWNGRTDDRPVREASARVHALGTGAALLGALALAGALGRTDAARPVVDAAVTAFAVWATVLTAWKARSSWLWWVGIDAVSAWLYAGRGLWLYAALMVGYTVAAAVAWRRWGSRESTFEANSRVE
jgi:nicotinamide mononucleotide transporter